MDQFSGAGHASGRRAISSRPTDTPRTGSRSTSRKRRRSRRIPPPGRRVPPSRARLWRPSQPMCRYRRRSLRSPTIIYGSATFSSSPGHGLPRCQSYTHDGYAFARAAHSGGAMVPSDASGSSSVGRASASQAEGRGFESRLPLRALGNVLCPQYEGPRLPPRLEEMVAPASVALTRDVCVAPTRTSLVAARSAPAPPIPLPGPAAPAATRGPAR